MCGVQAWLLPAGQGGVLACGGTALIDHGLPEFSLAPHEYGVRGYSPLARYFAIAQAPVPQRTSNTGLLYAMGRIIKNRHGNGPVCKAVRAAGPVDSTRF